MAYTVKQFADLSGVTVKALHYYERLGLLRPKRTNAAYRAYGDGDLERLEQIIALKFIGLSLKQIKDVLDRPAVDLRETLMLQRRLLQEKQQHLTLAISSLMDAESVHRRGEPANPDILKRVIEVVGMYEKLDAIKRHWDDGTLAKLHEAWEEARRDPRWKELRLEIQAGVTGGATAVSAHAMEARCGELATQHPDLFAVIGSPEFLAGAKSAYADQKNRPAGLLSDSQKARVREVMTFFGFEARGQSNPR
jgi:MerR family transcriptional regulator, thiopeptide resistance regulator